MRIEAPPSDHNWALLLAIRDGTTEMRPQAQIAWLCVQLYPKWQRQRREQKRLEKGAGIPYNEIVAYLNEVTGRAGVYRYQSRGRVHALIYRHWSDGYGDIKHFRAAIDNQAAQWRGTKYWSFMRPSTLFGPKFPEYVAAVPDEGAARPRTHQPFVGGAHTDVRAEQDKRGGE